MDELPEDIRLGILHFEIMSADGGHDDISYAAHMLIADIAKASADTKVRIARALQRAYSPCEAPPAAPQKS